MSKATPSAGPSRRRALAAGWLHAAVLLPVPALALALLAPVWRAGSLLPAAPSAATAECITDGAFLLSDLRDLSRVEPALRRVQVHPPTMPTDLRPGDEGVAALLNGWEQAGRTARRHKSSLDYFLGFGF